MPPLPEKTRDAFIWLLQLPEASSVQHPNLTWITATLQASQLSTLGRTRSHTNSAHSSQCLTMPASSPHSPGRLTGSTSKRPGSWRLLWNELSVQSLNNKNHYIGRLGPKSNPLEIQTESQRLL